MWVWLNGHDEPIDLFIPPDAPSSTGEFADQRQEVSIYWTGTEKLLGTGDDRDLDYFTGAYIILDSDGHYVNPDTLQHDRDGSPILRPEDRLYSFQLDRNRIEEAGFAGELDFETIDSGGGQ